ncbi:hypothetical protein CP49_33295 [Bradyrhizobium valentinum]|uniref:Uncharacterized protein n=1 Tax=Bradyrhizobium valentinum TaxID=1518501 RepID=A0A0R3KVE8_9BRAD|nr:hypothetical protein CP49_33295 [Bradyrhizobium valentinum]
MKDQQTCARAQGEDSDKKLTSKRYSNIGRSLDHFLRRSGSNYPEESLKFAYVNLIFTLFVTVNQFYPLIRLMNLPENVKPEPNFEHSN